MLGRRIRNIVTAYLGSLLVVALGHVEFGTSTKVTIVGLTSGLSEPFPVVAPPDAIPSRLDSLFPFDGDVIFGRPPEVGVFAPEHPSGSLFAK